MLKNKYFQLLYYYSKIQNINIILWENIEKNYSSKKRFYHTLTHLETMFFELEEIKTKIQNINVLMFSIFYHDIIYNAKNKDNELQSAEFMSKELSKTSFLEIDLCKKQILSTKKHLLSNDNDTNYLLDLDLVILGKNWNEYQQYFKNVRKEYSSFPDILYKTGRKNILKSFLKSKQIFKTNYFINKYEKTARENIQKEILLLNS